MLSPEDNEIINHCGPGTLMGNLMRRYWTPALLSEELPEPDCPPVKVRLLCEDLVAFRDSEGRVGLVDACCPHRGSGMFFGRNEEGGLRCVYHGWKFDVTGQCTDMPSEPPDSNYKDRLKISAYPTHESGGIVWTYMGPKDKMTGFRDFGTEGLPREQWRARKTWRPISYMQQLEGGLDTTHPSWLHMYSGAQYLDADADESDQPGVYNSSTALWKFWWWDRAPRVEVTEDWFGFKGVGLRTTPNGNTHARLYHWCLPYGAGGFTVPMDDTQTISFSFNTIYTEKRKELLGGRSFQLNLPGSPYAERAPAVRDIIESEVLSQRSEYETSRVANAGLDRNLENDFLIDRELQRIGTIYTGIGPGLLGSQNGFSTQDIMSRQTSFTDRTREHLGSLDRKIILVRRIIINAAKNLARGIEPPAIDPSLPYDKIEWPDKVLLSGEDWTKVGTEADPDYERVYGAASRVEAVPQITS